MFTDTTLRRLKVHNQNGVNRMAEPVELRAAIPGLGLLPDATLWRFGVPRRSTFLTIPD